MVGAARPGGPRRASSSRTSAPSRTRTWGTGAAAQASARASAEVAPTSSRAPTPCSAAPMAAMAPPRAAGRAGSGAHANGPLVAGLPLRQEGGLAVAGRRDEQHDRRRARHEPPGQAGPVDEPALGVRRSPRGAGRTSAGSSGEPQRHGAHVARPPVNVVPSAVGPGGPDGPGRARRRRRAAPRAPGERRRELGGGLPAQDLQAGHREPDHREDGDRRPGRRQRAPRDDEDPHRGDGAVGQARVLAQERGEVPAGVDGEPLRPRQPRRQHDRHAEDDRRLRDVAQEVGGDPVRVLHRGPDAVRRGEAVDDLRAGDPPGDEDEQAGHDEHPARLHERLASPAAAPGRRRAPAARARAPAGRRRSCAARRRGSARELTWSPVRILMRPRPGRDLAARPTREPEAPDDVEHDDAQVEDDRVALGRDRRRTCPRRR